MSIIIYKATNIGNNPENGKSYIGFSKHNLHKRKYKHLWEAQSNNISKCNFHIALRTFGFDSFSWEVFSSC